MRQKAAEELVDIIRDIVTQDQNNRDTTILCEVADRVDDTHYNLYVIPDKDNVIRNIPNMTNYDLEVGDNVYVYKINNQLSNAFICYKILPYAPKEDKTILVTDNTSRQFTTDDLKLFYVTEDGGHWYAMLSEYLFQKIKNSSHPDHYRINLLRKNAHKSRRRLGNGMPDKIISAPRQIGSEYIHSMSGSVVYPTDVVISNSRIVDMTNIINQYILKDNIIAIKSVKAAIDNYQKTGYWYKKFGVCVINDAGGILYSMPLDQFFTVKNFSLDPNIYNNFTEDNIFVDIDNRVVELREINLE